MKRKLTERERAERDKQYLTGYRLGKESVVKTKDGYHITSVTFNNYWRGQARRGFCDGFNDTLETMRMN